MEKIVRQLLSDSKIKQIKYTNEYVIDRTNRNENRAVFYDAQVFTLELILEKYKKAEKEIDKTYYI